MKQGNTRLARLLLRIAGIANALAFFPICCEASFMPGASGMWAMLLLPLGFGIVALLYATSQGLWFEMDRERIWNKVCKGLGGNFVVEKPSYKFGLIGAYYFGDSKVVAPKLRKCHGTRDAWTGVIETHPGQTVDDYTSNAQAYAHKFSVPFVTFEDIENGRISIRAGQLPVPAASAFTGHLHMAQARDNQPLLQQSVQPSQTQQAQFKQPVPKPTLSLDEVPPGVLKAAESFAKMRGLTTVPPVYASSQQEPDLSRELELIKALPMARDMQGRWCRIPVASNHWFIAARTNSGKSSWIWGLVLGLAPAWATGLVKLWGIDSKWCELGFELGFWDHYASKDAECVELLESAVVEMQARLQTMQGVSRKFTPTVQTPLNVVVIDEMAYLTAYQADRKLRDRAQAAISALLSAGRSPGFAVVSAVQDPRKEVCGFRDLFSIRIAGSLPEPMVDLVLGEGMYDLGARCNQLPIGDAGAGAAYVISETTLRPILVRAPYPDDTAIKQTYLKAVRRKVSNDQLKVDDLSLQPDWTSQPMQQQWQYRVE